MRSRTKTTTWRQGFARLATLWLIGCLAAGGLLLAKGMAAGPPQPRLQTKAIEQVKVGDWVLAKDPGHAGPPTAHKVLALPRNWTEHIVHVRMIGGGEVESTRMHPFWVQGSGWTRAKDLKAGDRLVDQSDHLVEVSSIRVEDRTTGTFNLTVDGVHTFYVMAGEGSVLVHNSVMAMGEGEFRDLPNDLSPTVRGPDLGQVQGRQFGRDWLATNQFDPYQPSYVRGWLANEQRQLANGNICEIRNPPGLVMGHGMGTRAEDGFDYSNATLQGEDLNILEESVRSKISITTGGPCP